MGISAALPQILPKSGNTRLSYWWFNTFYQPIFGASSSRMDLRVAWLKLYQTGQNICPSSGLKSLVYTADIFFFLKRGRPQMTGVENWGRISDVFTPTLVKIRKGVGEIAMSMSAFQVYFPWQMKCWLAYLLTYCTWCSTKARRSGR